MLLFLKDVSNIAVFVLINVFEKPFNTSQIFSANMVVSFFTWYQNLLSAANGLCMDQNIDIAFE